MTGSPVDNLLDCAQGRGKGKTARSEKLPRIHGVDDTAVPTAQRENDGRNGQTTDNGVRNATRNDPGSASGDLVFFTVNITSSGEMKTESYDVLTPS